MKLLNTSAVIMKHEGNKGFEDPGHQMSAQ